MVSLLHHLLLSSLPVVYKVVTGFLDGVLSSSLLWLMFLFTKLPFPTKAFLMHFNYLITLFFPSYFFFFIISLNFSHELFWRLLSTAEVCSSDADNFSSSHLHWISICFPNLIFVLHIYSLILSGSSLLLLSASYHHLDWPISFKIGSSSAELLASFLEKMVNSLTQLNPSTIEGH